ncbi:4Fe-4S binding protein [Aquabacterium sp.]|uniref:4Fe-4S binding protein n=1 Tax=Aquabacterium sp. TaxID=1872578 RepID=UPI0035B01154
MKTIAIIPVVDRPPRPRGALARLGDAMARHRGVILALQWIVVLAYAVLVAVPAFMPLPDEHTRILNSLTRFAQFAFWGVWWPFVIVSIMALGRVWCGVLCPEGALSEWASRHSLGRAIPRWMRWPGWPLVGFAGTTLYGQMLSVYDYPAPAALILGGSTLAAIGIGLVYGRNKRVWCRYLCPVSGVFALLSRVSPLHFKVDREAWRAYPQRVPAPDCAPLLNVGAMTGAAQCHQCGRCSGHRDAVEWRWRWPGSEILASRAKDIARYEIALLLYGTIGMAYGAFQWSMAPSFVVAKQKLAEWLIERDILWPFDDSAPWWVLTHYPQASDVFTWLDGACIVGWIALHALVLGATAQCCLWLAARLARLDMRRLALGLVPVAGGNLFLGLSMLTLSQLRAEGITFNGVATARALVLALMTTSALALGAALLRQARPGATRALAAFALYAAPVLGFAALWARAFGW